MEVVITFANGDQSRQHVVARCVLIVEGGFAEVMRERIDAEGRVMNEAKTHCSRVDVTSHIVTPQETRNDSGQGEAHPDDKRKVPAMLPLDDGVLAEVADVRSTGLAPWLDNHPPDVRPDETVVRAVRVEVSISVAVVSAMASAPPLDRAFDGACTSHGQEVFERLGRIVRAMRPQTMVT